MLFTPRIPEPLPFALDVQGINNPQMLNIPFGTNAAMPQILSPFAPPSQVISPSQLVANELNAPSILPQPVANGTATLLPSNMQAGVAPIDVHQELLRTQADEPQVTQQQATQPSKRAEALAKQQQSGGALSGFHDSMRNFVQSPLFGGLMNAARLIAASGDPKSAAYQDAVKAIMEGNQQAREIQDLEQALIKQGFAPQEARVMARNKDAMNALIQLRSKEREFQQEQAKNVQNKYGQYILSVDEKEGTVVGNINGSAVTTSLPGSKADLTLRNDYKTLHKDYTWYKRVNQSSLYKIRRMKDLVPNMSKSDFGLIGKMKATFAPGSAAAEFQDLLFSFKSERGLEELRRLKEIGGNLGQVTQGEHNLLQAVDNIITARIGQQRAFEELLRLEKALGEQSKSADVAYKQDQATYIDAVNVQRQFFPNARPLITYDEAQSQQAESSKTAVQEEQEGETWWEAEAAGKKRYYDKYLQQWRNTGK